MKKFIKYLMSFFLGALILAGSGMCQSCRDHRPRIPIDDEEFQEKLDKYLPSAMQNMYSFEDVTDVMLYKQERSAQHFIDSVFISMSDQEVANVVTVLKKEQPNRSRFGVSDIVYEYRAGQRIYSNLPDPSSETTSKSEQPDPPVAATDSTTEVKIQAYSQLKKD